MLTSVLRGIVDASIRGEKIKHGIVNWLDSIYTDRLFVPSGNDGAEGIGHIDGGSFAIGALSKIGSVSAQSIIGNNVYSYNDIYWGTPQKSLINFVSQYLTISSIVDAYQAKGIGGLDGFTITQLKNMVYNNTVSSDQWEYISHFNQGLSTSDNVNFRRIESANGINVNDGNFSISNGSLDIGAGSVSAGGSIRSLLGSITVDSGDIYVTNGGISTTGNIVTTNGSIVVTDDILSYNGNVIAAVGNIITLSGAITSKRDISARNEVVLNEGSISSSSVNGKLVAPQICYSKVIKANPTDGSGRNHIGAFALLTSSGIPVARLEGYRNCYRLKAAHSATAHIHGILPNIIINGQEVSFGDYFTVGQLITFHWEANSSASYNNVTIFYHNSSAHSSAIRFYNSFCNHMQLVCASDRQSSTDVVLLRTALTYIVSKDASRSNAWVLKQVG